MSSPYIGEIRLFAGNFAPDGWKFCNGESLPISEYDTLFNLIGTTYGGDGISTFNVPDLQGRIPLGFGTGSGLSPRQIGEKGGVEQVTLGIPQMPAHTHIMVATSESANTQKPTNNVALAVTTPLSYSEGKGRGFTPVPLNYQTVGMEGGGGAHENRSPYFCINFIISLFGIYPPQG